MSATGAERFFYDHAGFSYDPIRETPLAGRIRTARLMASDEEWLERMVTAGTLRRLWGDDESGDHSYVDTGDFPEINTCEWCSLLNEAGTVVYASLGCIDNADDDYRRVVEAELAGEARDTIESAGLVSFA